MRIDQTKNEPEKQTGIIVPPGCDNPMLHQCGEMVSTYIPESYKSITALDSSIPPMPHPMHGKSGGLSVPKNDTKIAQKSMTEYLNKFQGAYLCLDLWADSNFKIKKCGTLLEVGKDFLVLKENRNMRLTVIDLKPIKYINIYCK